MAEQVTDKAVLKQKAQEYVEDAGMSKGELLEQINEWVDDCGCEALDGCWVEPDGHCEHGYPSWLIYLGLI